MLVSLLFKLTLHEFSFRFFCLYCIYFFNISLRSLTPGYKYVAALRHRSDFYFEFCPVCYNTQSPCTVLVNL
jgi:hypothetical protein